MLFTKWTVYGNLEVFCDEKWCFEDLERSCVMFIERGTWDIHQGRRKVVSSSDGVRMLDRRRRVSDVVGRLRLQPVRLVVAFPQGPPVDDPTTAHQRLRHGRRLPHIHLLLRQ